MVDSTNVYWPGSNQADLIKIETVRKKNSKIWKMPKGCMHCHFEIVLRFLRGCLSTSTTSTERIRTKSTNNTPDICLHKSPEHFSQTFMKVSTKNISPSTRIILSFSLLDGSGNKKARGSIMSSRMLRSLESTET